MVYLYAVATHGKNRSGKYVILRYGSLPAGCMSRPIYYRAVQELRDAGFLRVIIGGEFHNKKTVYEMRYF